MMQKTSLKNKLLASYLKVGMLCVLMLASVLLVYIFVRTQTTQLTTYSAPMFENVKIIESNVYKSMAALQGWVFTGDKQFKKEREEAWDFSIYPALYAIQDITNQHPDDIIFNKVKSLQEDLVALKYWQWHVEDVARTEGNIKINKFYKSKFIKVYNVLNRYIDDLIAYCKNRELSKELFYSMKLQNSLAKSFNAINSFINSGYTIYEDEFLTNIKDFIVIVDDFTSSFNVKLQNGFNLLDTIYREVSSFRIMGIQIISERKKQNWNIAEYWIKTFAIPTFKRVESSLLFINDQQTELMHKNSESVYELISATPNIIFFLIIATISVIVLMAIYTARKITTPILSIVDATKKLATDDKSIAIDTSGDDEIGELARVLNDTKNILLSKDKNIQEQLWLRNGKNNINDIIRKAQKLNDLLGDIVKYLSEYLKIPAINIFLLKENKTLHLIANYGSNIKDIEIKLGEGACGEAAKTNKIIKITNDKLFTITSGFGNINILELIAIPISQQEKVLGVVELYTIKPLSDLSIDFIVDNIEIISMAILSSQSRDKLNKTYAELQTQSEELRASNEELESQTQALKESEEEMRVTNEELEEMTKELNLKNKSIEQTNNELRLSKLELENKMKELDRNSKYKSEFLANMSHEVRTPLNSMLILAKTLSDNKLNNLTEKQVKCLNMINIAGKELLILINDILDLSKVEAGKLEISKTKIIIESIVTELVDEFEEIIRQSKAKFTSKIAENVPIKIYSDQLRLKQIMKNFLSNAFKFTNQGEVLLTVNLNDKEIRTVAKNYKPGELVCFSVVDSGIGISEENLREIFGAFKQADGSISRKYGGTGLGLAISKKLAELLGGAIEAKSSEHKGSKFSLYLPFDINVEEIEKKVEKVEKIKESIEETIKKPNHKDVKEVNKENVRETGKSILIIHSDHEILNKIVKTIESKNMPYKIASTGKDGLEIAASGDIAAIILGVKLSDYNGLRIFQLLKTNPVTCDIPIHIHFEEEQGIGEDEFVLDIAKNLNSIEKNEELQKIFKELYYNKNDQKLLIIDDDEIARNSISAMVSEVYNDISLDFAETANIAYQKIAKQHFDCVILDFYLPDMSGIDLLNKLKNDKLKVPHVIINTGYDLSEKEKRSISIGNITTIIKGQENSVLRLIEEIGVFLHKVKEESKDSKSNKPKLNSIKNKHILVVDDDARNSFALSEYLEQQGLKVTVADNGFLALELLEKHPDIDLVLMDIMMPEMDGYTAIGKIRADNKLKNLPVIALTAKAMKGDQHKCLEAGANDYMAKPIDVDKLFALMKIWLLI